MTRWVSYPKVSDYFTAWNLQTRNQTEERGNFVAGSATLCCNPGEFIHKTISPEPLQGLNCKPCFSFRNVSNGQLFCTSLGDDEFSVDSCFVQVSDFIIVQLKSRRSFLCWHKKNLCKVAKKEGLIFIEQFWFLIGSKQNVNLIHQFL